MGYDKERTFSPSSIFLIPLFREGHRVSRKGDFLGSQSLIRVATYCRRQSLVGKAEGKWPMSIRCMCPNGHVLKVKESQAGMTGLCPACRAKVRVPRPRPATEPVTEDAILDILGRQPHSPQADTATYYDTSDTVPLPGVQERGTPKKSCYKCNEEIDSGTHICPHCHTYIAKLEDF
jgi:hypothetical protein